MLGSETRFAGAIPNIYDRFFVPLLFEPYANDLAERVEKLAPDRVLKTAAGTGVLTQAMASRLRANANIIATDLNGPMLEVAQAKLPHDRRIAWREADALDLPFDDDAFDVVVCQFGAMFFPDKVKAYREARRV